MSKRGIEAGSPRFDPGRPWLAERARVDPRGVALVVEGREWSWEELAQEALTQAAELAAAGVARGDLVAVDLPSGLAFVATLHALQSMGAAMLPLNQRLSTPERERILAHAEPVAVLGPHGILRSASSPGAAPRRAAARTSGLAPEPAVRAARSVRAPGSMVSCDPMRTFHRVLAPEAVLTVVFTSGTTSLPKGVMLTNANHRAAAEASRQRLGHGPEDAWLCTMPLFHIGGLAILVRSVLEGSRVLLEPGFDADRVRSAISRGEATMVPLVPTMLARVLASPLEGRSPRLRAVLVGGAALPAPLARRALAAGLPLSATWGMTEGCSQLCTTLPGDARAALGSAGLPLQGVKVQVRNPDAAGIGELWVRGASVSAGYLRNKDADSGSFEDGWLRTGDLGCIAEDGSVSVAGRRDDLLITGGENVSPQEVEKVLDAHPRVAEALVFGIPDAEWGHRIAALVVPAAAEDCNADNAPCPCELPDRASLEAWCRERLAAYKVPREFRFVEALPRNATGKLLRRAAASVATVAAASAGKP